MALVELEKKGGRYSKRQQEERRLQVFHYYFELDKSALWISQELGVSRNTINADIQFLRTQVVDETGSVDIKAKMFQQIQKMEIQRDRILDCLDKCETDK